MNEEINVDKNTVIETGDTPITEEDKEDWDDEKPMIAPKENGLVKSLIGEFPKMKLKQYF